MSKNKFCTPVMERDAFLTIIVEGRISGDGSGSKGDREKPNLVGINKLWRSVIAQAFIDAMSNSKKAILKREKEKAIAWLLGRSEEFFTVCSLADADPDLVYQRAKKMFGSMERKQDISKFNAKWCIERKSWVVRTDAAHSWQYSGLAQSQCAVA